MTLLTFKLHLSHLGTGSAVPRWSAVTEVLNYFWANAEASNLLLLMLSFGFEIPCCGSGYASHVKSGPFCKKGMEKSTSKEWGKEIIKTSSP